MPLGLGTALWGVILPKETTNLVLNPSFEFGNLGVAAIQSATLGTSSQFQQYGAWSLSVTPNSNGTSGAALGTWTATNGAAYSISMYVRGANGIDYRAAVADSNGVNFVSGGTTTFTGGGTWQRVSWSYTEPSGAVRRPVLTKAGANDTTAIYIDGLQVELGSVSTYIDGDQPGGTWNGAQHASTSFRSGQYRGGGSVVALADLGLQVNDMLGAGVPPIEVSTQSYAVIDGAEFQRQRGAQRKFTLTGKPVVGTSLADFHVTRRTLYDAFKPDLVTPQQPVRFVYVGAQGTQQLDGYYDSGLELGNMDGPIAESLGVSFIATDPYWYAPTQQGTTFAANIGLGSTNYIVKRTPTGVWGTLGANGTTINSDVSALTSVQTITVNPGGTVFIGGYFGTLGGTWANGIGMYYPATNTFGTLTGGTIDNGGGSVTVRAMQFTPFGSLFIAGNTFRYGGTVSPNIGQWNGNYGTLTGGTIDVNNQAYSLVYSPTGTLFLGGNFNNAGGTTARNIAQWANGSWGTLAQGGGTLTNRVDTLAWALDNSLYAAGIFDKAGGTTAGSIARYNGTWGTLAGGGGSGGGVTDIGIKPDGRIAVVGGFVTSGGITTNGVAEYTGAGWMPVGVGITGGYALTVGVRRDNSYIVAGSFTGIGGITTPDPIALWTGAAYQPIGIDLPGATPTIYSVLETDDKTLYMAGIFTGTAQASAGGSVVNLGRSLAYPTIRMRNLAAGTARVWYLQNFTTQAGLFFNLSLLPSEIATLNLTPGNRSFTSNFRGNIFGAIMPGGNLASFNLLPGTNNLSFYCDNGSLEMSIFWPLRGWSIDSGTIY